MTTMLELADEIEAEADNISPTKRTHPAGVMIQWANRLRVIDFALRQAAPGGGEGATPQQVQEACAQVADRASISDFEWATKYPDEREKYEQRGFRANSIAVSIRALIPPALPQEAPDMVVAARCKNWAGDCAAYTNTEAVCEACRLPADVLYQLLAAGKATPEDQQWAANWLRELHGLEALNRKE